MTPEREAEIRRMVRVFPVTYPEAAEVLAELDALRAKVEAVATLQRWNPDEPFDEMERRENGMWLWRGDVLGLFTEPEPKPGGATR